MASFVDNETADLTLKSLFSKSPYEVLAVAAESRLFEEPGGEFVVLDLLDVLLSESSSPLNRKTANHGPVASRGLGVVIVVPQFNFCVSGVSHLGWEVGWGLKTGGKVRRGIDQKDTTKHLRRDSDDAAAAAAAASKSSTLQLVFFVNVPNRPIIQRLLSASSKRRQERNVQFRRVLLSA